MLRSPWNKMRFLKVNLIVYYCPMFSLLRIEKKCIIYFYIWYPPKRTHVVRRYLVVHWLINYMMVINHPLTAYSWHML